VKGSVSLSQITSDINNQIDMNDVLKNYADMIYKLALAHTKNISDSEDVFQEVFFKYLKNKTKFQSKEHQKAWLIRVTINVSNKILSSAWRRRTVPFKDDIEFNPEENIVYYSIIELPIKYRTVLHLHYYEDMTISDISSVLKIKESTIKSQLLRAKALLKEKLKGDYNGY
jgi:RNA polymerase sigma-70 factor (ECF subfamily)